MDVKILVKEEQLCIHNTEKLLWARTPVII